MSTKELLIEGINHASEGNQLVGVLNALDVPFLLGGNSPVIASDMNPSMLVRALAMSDEARLRLAIIPLILRHPEFAIDVELVGAQLPQNAQILLKCYYTAGYLLQQKYHRRLQALFGDLTPLPDLFCSELGLSNVPSVDDGLHLLSQRHCLLSGRSINWLGTYEHGAQRLMIHYERRQSWQRSP